MPYPGVSGVCISTRACHILPRILVKFEKQDARLSNTVGENTEQGNQRIGRIRRESKGLVWLYLLLQVLVTGQTNDNISFGGTVTEPEIYIQDDRLLRVLESSHLFLSSSPSMSI